MRKGCGILIGSGYWTEVLYIYCCSCSLEAKIHQYNKLHGQEVKPITANRVPQKKLYLLVKYGFATTVV